MTKIQENCKIGEVIEIKTNIYYYQYLNDDEIIEFLKNHINNLFHFRKDDFSYDPNIMKITRFDKKGNEIINTLKKGDYIFVYNEKISIYDKNKAIDLLFEYRKLASQ